MVTCERASDHDCGGLRAFARAEPVLQLGAVWAHFDSQSPSNARCLQQWAAVGPDRQKSASSQASGYFQPSFTVERKVCNPA